jgi:hypothetical protein
MRGPHPRDDTDVAKDIARDLAEKSPLRSPP